MGTETETCDAKIRPFQGTTEISCEVEGDHNRHKGTLRDYAYPGSETVITWLESDRRTYHGKWPGDCLTWGCTLPARHKGRCEVQ